MSPLLRCIWKKLLARQRKKKYNGILLRKSNCVNYIFTSVGFWGNLRIKPFQTICTTTKICYFSTLQTVFHSHKQVMPLFQLRNVAGGYKTTKTQGVCTRAVIHSLHGTASVDLTPPTFHTRDCNTIKSSLESSSRTAVQRKTDQHALARHYTNKSILSLSVFIGS